MRTIKFRAWDGEQMVSPDYIGRDGRAYWKANSILTSSERVMQFTGLLDKNGKEIYEGDIVRTGVYTDRTYSNQKKGIKHIGYVEYSIGEGDFADGIHKQFSGEWRVIKPDFYKSIYTCGNWGDFFECEVIGNIHENSNLLK